MAPDTAPQNAAVFSGAHNEIGIPVIIRKFRDCASFSAHPIPTRNLDRVIEMVGDLENLSDATDIIRLLT